MSYEDVPTVIINKFSILKGGGFFRIAFGEQVIPGGDTKFRIAICITEVDAKELADCIYKTMAQPQPKENEDAVEKGKVEKSNIVKH